MPACGANRHRRTRPRRDKVRAPNDLRLYPRSCRTFVFSGEKPMTAYLILLALIGLVVIAVSEEVS
jgi:hypothetical protein